MISGTKSASTAAWAMLSSYLPMAVAVNVSPRNSAASQPPRFLHMGQKPVSKYGASSASLPPSFWISRVAFFWANSSTSSAVMMPSIFPSLSTTGRATRSYFSNVATTSSPVAVAGIVTSGRASIEATVAPSSGQHQRPEADVLDERAIDGDHVQNR